MKRIFGTRKRIIPMDEKDVNRLAAEAEREIGDILRSPAPPRPVMRVLNPETPQPAETPEAPLPLRTVSERLAELQERLGMVESKIDLIIAVLR